MATSSPFSYAQAAKGQAAQVATTPTSEPTEVKNNSTQDAEQSPDSLAVLSNSGIEGKASEHASLSTDSKVDVAQEQGKGSTSRETNSESNSESNTPSLTGSRREDSDAPADNLSQGDEKRAVRSSSASTRLTDDSDFKKGQRKGRKGKATGTSAADSDKVKDKEEEKEKEKELPKVELTEAPLPLVNIWTQRKEAQAAKLKPNVATNVSSIGGDAPTAASTGSNASQEAKKKSKTSEAGSLPKTTHNGHPGAFKGQRKAGEDGRGENDGTARRGAPRGSRVAEKAEALPPSADSSAWPTPETAIREEKRKPTDRVEKPEPSEPNDDTASTKTRKKEQWERIDFVPTVNWETPVPALRGSRGGRGGGSGRGGRDVTSRGGSHVASSAPVAADKPADVTPAVASKGANDQRDKARDGAPSHRGNAPPSAVAKQSTADNPRNKDHRKPSGPARGDRVKDSTSTQSADQAVPPRSEGRGEKGGRGGGPYRGSRGGHPANSHAMHAQAQYLPNGGPYSHPPMSSRHQNFTSPPLSQGNSFSQGFGSQGRPGGRGGANRQSSASTGYSHRGNGANGNSARPRPLSTQNMAPYTWDTYAGMPMTAPPYPPQLFNYELKAVLTQQVEYYFSVNNLCKDGHLRRHMDSQGFVFLSIIHGFARVKQLSGDNYTFLRASVADSTQLDFVAGKDGIDRIRSRHHWQKFVLPMDQRVEAAQTAGPEYFYYQSIDQQAMNSMVAGGYPMGSPTSYANGTTFDPSGYANGAHVIDGNGAQLSATVPEFQPGMYNTQLPDQEGNSVSSKPTASTSSPNGPAAEPEGTSQTASSHVNGTSAIESQPSGVLES
ncbi:hypothetical protein SODALDRAFT_280824 [Sodiomyces alkalinus F11]|uniref:HTH La-type RNA-binding domain-containing protein n=1 Tax=Sodiomyces alkalinus (strain CBS 110278 / VKM F-3762 / F11) TaxID=1314773 RepID=A0A3N2PR98_SODAK|nr:hypothetical protein SODALDRAFT_280824 [Sodiomyces alkalinus F11]ROT37008.1 hypothetical protein SODALDRAFT_280824 [Sodiomyces alkalinus F11]